MLTGPFLEPPYENSDGYLNVHDWSAPRGFVSRNTLTILDFFFTFVYIFDWFVIFIAQPDRNTVANSNFTFYGIRVVSSGTFRLVSSLLIEIDCILWLSGVNTGRFSRALVPAIYISRRSSFRNIVTGVFKSIRTASSIFKLLFFIVIIWGFVGFCLFRESLSDINEKTEDDTTDLQRFDTIWKALFTCLLCFTSRVSVLYVMNPFYKISQLSANYFVTLTIVADILCLNLMIAVGNSEFSFYSAQLFMSRLKRRL